MVSMEESMTSDRQSRERVRGANPAMNRIQTQGGIISPDIPAFMEHARIRSVFHAEQGSDMTLGLRLHLVLREAGFVEVIPSASLEMFVSPQEKRGIADWAIDTTRSETFREITTKLRLADEATLARHIREFEDFAANPDSWVAGPNGEAVGWKPIS